MKKASKAVLAAFVSLSSVGAVGCGSSGSNGSSGSSDTTVAVSDTGSSDTTAASSDSTDTQLTDPQIASIALTANQIDVEYADIALEKATDPEVKEFAESMKTDHQAVIDQATELAGKLGVTPEDNPTTQSLLDGAEKVKAKFADLSGAAFDKAYIDNEVSYHKAAIGVVTDDLIPSTTNPELKSLLEKALPLFQGHLEHAEAVQADLS